MQAGLSWLPIYTLDIAASFWRRKPRTDRLLLLNHTEMHVPGSRQPVAVLKKYVKALEV